MTERNDIAAPYESLAEIAQLVTASLDLSEVLEAVVRAATGLVPDSISRIWSLEEDRLVLRAEVNLRVPGSGAHQLAMGEGLVGHVWAEAEVLVVDDVMADHRLVNRETARAEGLNSFVGIPLVAHKRFQGVLAVFTRGPHRFSADELTTLISFGQQAAIAIENARLFAREQAARTAAEASQHRLRDLVDRMDAIVAEADARTFRFSFVSRSAETILGYPIQQWLDEPDFWTRHLHPDDRDRTVDRCLVETREGRDHTLEYRMVAVDGRVVWVRDTVRVVRDPEGRPAALQCLLVDISERKRAETLLASEKHVLAMSASGAPLSEVLDALCAAVETLSDGAVCSLLLRDAGGGRLRHAAAPSLPAEYVAAIDGIQIGPDVGSCGTAAHEGRPVVAEDIGIDPRWDAFRHLALPHGLRACWSTPIFARDGNVLGTFAVYYRTPRRPTPVEERLIERATDIAALVIARERAEQALQAQAAALAASEARHRALLANTPDAAWCIDQAGRALFVSPRIEAVTSLSAAEFAARGRQVWRERVHPDDERAIDEGWIGLFEGGGTYDVEYRFCRKDGRWVWLHSRAVTIDSEAGQPLAYGVVSDITERKQASEIRARLLNQAITAQEEERRRIARELHDDTAQSLASLLVGLDVLRSARTLRDARRQAQDLHRVAASALDDVRLLARGLRPSVLDDLGLLAAAERYATEFQKSRGIDVYVRASGVGKRLPASVETALYRIMQEALANVAKHAGARAASVVIERRAASVAMAVSDDGHGFDVGAVLADSQQAGHMGLHGMRERALLLDGTLAISSVPGAGTRVLAEVPLLEGA
jgi:PAS domain S-box-containing protein